jgi:transcription initiation factor TFIID subunit TAF12
LIVAVHNRTQYHESQQQQQQQEQQQQQQQQQQQALPYIRRSYKSDWDDDDATADCWQLCTITTITNTTSAHCSTECWKSTLQCLW